ncbi:Hypothetical protein D9617_26g079200 [Elsinoe fawcettii]|nr:Hypothetical protein D9617_26g079200 [Elsinoe fawcettii]
MERQYVPVIAASAGMEFTDDEMLSVPPIGADQAQDETLRNLGKAAARSSTRETQRKQCRGGFERKKEPVQRESARLQERVLDELADSTHITRAELEGLQRRNYQVRPAHMAKQPVSEVPVAAIKTSGTKCDHRRKVLRQISIPTKSNSSPAFSSSTVEVRWGSVQRDKREAQDSAE